MSDADVIRDLRGGDEAAFVRLVDELSPRMLKMARLHAGGEQAAEDVVQEAWLVVVRDLDRFEERSSLSTWVLGVVLNLARSRGRADARARPFSALAEEGSALPPERFLPADHDRWPGHWAIAPAPWPERALETAEAERTLRAAIATLPEAQRAVITLRDVVGCSPAETCEALGLTAVHQRVLLHRARTKVRAALEAAFDATEVLG